MRPLGILFAMAEFCTRKDQHTLIKMWVYCETHGHVNGYRARKAMRQAVDNVAGAINLEIKAKAAREYARREVGVSLTNRVKRRKRRALE